MAHLPRLCQIGLVCALLGPGSDFVQASELLVSGQLQVQGTRLTLYQDANGTDAEQWPNLNEAARVRTCFGRTGAVCGVAEPSGSDGSGLLVQAELRGPELPEPVPYQTVPGGSFLLPAFQQEGDYWLSNIRLVRAETGEVIGLAEPAAAVFHVQQILLTSAKVTRLSLADLEARGITLSQQSFQAYSFAVGFAIQGSTVTVEMPVVFQGNGSVGMLSPPAVELASVPENLRPVVMRWQPPRIVPFKLEISPGEGGLSPEDVESNGPRTYPLFGAIVLPGTISFLNQFFDARLIVANGAPDDSGAILSNITGTLRLPPGNVLRLAQTNPPVVAGQAVPVVGENGVRSLPAGQQGAAVWTLEGLAAGTHAARIDITADLERPGRPVLPLTGSTQAAVEVVDARFHLSFSHPDVVREDEDYSLFVTVSNLSRAVQNLVTVAMDDAHLTGAHKAGVVSDPEHCTLSPFQCTIPTLAPGQSETLEFRLAADITGEVVATTYQATSVNAQGSIHLRTGVGLLGIPLSPASLILPRFSNRLKTPYLPTDSFHRANMRFLGLAYSLAVAPAGAAPNGLPHVIKSDVERRAVDLAESGQRTWLGDDTLASLEVLALDLLGNRRPLEEIDALRRSIGARLGANSQASTLGEVLRLVQTQKNLDAVGMLDHLAETTSYCAPYLAAVLTPTTGLPRPELEIHKRLGEASGYLTFPSTHAAPLRSLPFGEIFALQAQPGGEPLAELALVGRVATAATDGLYDILLHNQTGDSQAGRLVVIVPDGESSEFRKIDYGTITVPPHTVYEVKVGAGVPTPGGFIFTFAGGAPAPDVPGPVVSTVVRPPFRVIGSRQDFSFGSDSDRYGYGLGVAYLFNRPPEAALTATPSAFQIRSTFSGLDVNDQPAAGEAIKTGQAVFFQDDERVVVVRYSAPLSALVGVGVPLVSHQHELDAAAIRDRWDASLTGEAPPPEIEMSPLHTGALVDGRVVHGTGEPAAGATVQLLRVRHTDGPDVLDVVAEQTAEADGRFYFDFVEEPARHGRVGQGYVLRATVQAGADPTLDPPQVTEVWSVARLSNRLAHVNIALLGRGSITGHLRYQGGGPVVGGTVRAVSTLFGEMKSVRVADDGSFSIAGMPVGPITLTGEDADRFRVFATVGIERPGDSVVVELQIQRQEEKPPTFGEVEGVVLVRQADGSTGLVDGATVAVYSQGGVVGTATSGADGSFRISMVPTGQVTVQAANWTVSRSPAVSDLILAEGQVARVTLLLVQLPVRSVVGRVMLADPVGGEMTAIQGAAVFIPGPGTFSYTQADGRFRLDGVPGQGPGEPGYQLTAIDMQRRLQGSVVLSLILPESPEVIEATDIVLREMTGGVDGIVLDPLGRPCGGVSVVIFPFAEKAAGADGRFSFDGIGIGTHNVIAHVGNGLLPGRVGYFGEAQTRVVFAGHRPFVTVRLRGGGVVRAVTRTATSSGVLSFVQYGVPYYSAREYRIMAKVVDGSTDENGLLEFESPVGTYSIEAYNPFHGSRAVRDEIAFPGQVRTHDIIFQELSTVRGVVVDVDGVTPVPGASVSLATATLLPQTQQTDALGRFEYRLVPPGNVLVAASGTVGTVERVGQVITGSMQPGQMFDVTVRLKAQGTVRGQVVERVNGELVPVPGAHFRLNESDYPQRSLPAGQEWSFADGEGRFSVSHVFAGRVSATVRHPETLVYGGAKGTLSADWEVVDLGQIELKHDVGSIVVTVRDPVTGAVVPDCQVSTGDDRGTTDSDGRARFDVLSLFLHQFYAFHAPTGRSGRLGDVRLSTPGQIVEATLYLEARGEVTGHLYEDAGKAFPVAGASVVMSGGGVGGGLSAMATTSGETATRGRFGFSGIPAGHFDLLAWTPSSPRKARGSIDVSTTAPLATVDLFLERIGELDVRVLEKLQAGLVELDPGQHVLSVEVVQDCLAQGCVYAFTRLEPGVPSPGHLFQFADVLGDRPVHVSVTEFDGEQRSGYVFLDRVGDGQGTSVNPIAVVLGPRAVVQVVVRDALGNALEGVPVVVALGGAGWSTTVVSGADGMATAVGVPAGSVFASATLQGQGGSAQGLLEFDDQVLQLAISLSPSVVAHGVVYRPVPGDAVGTGTTLVPQSRAIASLTDTNGAVHVALTGEDGVYRFSGLPVGGYALKICDYTCEAEASISGLLSGPHGADIALEAVVLDAVRPEVVSIVPPPGTEGISRMAAVEVTFSEPLHASVLPTPQGGSAFFSVVSSSGQPAVGTWTATVNPSDGRQVVRFVPSEALENLTWYSLLIKGTDAGVKDRAGRLLSSLDHVGSSFKTSDTIGPSIVATDPSLLRPVPQGGALRVDFSEVVKAQDGMLDGVGGDDAAALTWEKRSLSGEVTLEPFPLTLQLTRGDSSLLIHRAEGISLDGDTGWRELTIRGITDLHDNPMVPKVFRFRTRDANPPELTLNPPANAPGGDLAAGTTYLLLPQFLPQSLDDPFPPQAEGGDVEKVEYFLTEPLVGSPAPPTFTATGAPFGFSFVAPSGVSGTELKVWARATDSSANQGGLAAVVMHVVPNQTPVVGSVTVQATSPVAGTAYAGSRMQVTSTGLGDPDGALLSVQPALVPVAGGAAVATLPAQGIARPASGKWSDLGALSFELTLPLSVAEGTVLVARVTVTDSVGASDSGDSASFTVAADEGAPTIEGLLARRADGEAATLFFIGQQLQLEMRVREVETATSAVAVAFSSYLGPVVATLVPGTVNLYRTPLIAVPEVAGEVSIAATATATDIGGNPGTATTTFTIAPTSDPYDPAVTWLTPWEGAPWPAAYTSVVTSRTGCWLLVRVKVTDLDLSGSEVVPGTIASVSLRGPVLDAGTIALAPEWSPASRLAVDGVPSDIWELPWLIPNGVQAQTSLPFEVRVSDAGANVVTRSVRMQAVPFRKVYEGTLTAVLPGDPMVGAGGINGGSVFLLDGAIVSLYPQDNATMRALPSLHLYSGGQASGDAVVVHPSVLTVPEVTSPSSPILYYPLDLQIDENLGIGHGARIETTARGLLGSVPTQEITLPGLVPAERGAGGSHGGKGWFGSPGGWQRADLWAAGSVYDSVRSPHLPGGAGGWQDGAPVAGGTGGGVIRILAGSANVFVAGEVAANGSEGPATASGTGGGAGGSVHLVAGRVEGPGRILAEGGRGHYNDRTGGGGGGRVAVTYRELGADFDPARSVSVSGGQNEEEGSASASYLGGAGTVFWQALDAATGLPVGSGHLLIANAAGLPAALTPLPSLGEGEVLGVDVGARTLTLSSQEIAGEMGGESVVVKVAGEAERIWRITSHEPVVSGGVLATRLAVEAGDADLQSVASALAGARTVTFVGRSRFSSISVRGAARLVTEDDLEVGDVNPGLNDRGSFVLEGDGQLLLRGDRPVLTVNSTPAGDSDVPVGGTIFAPWSASGHLGLRWVDRRWASSGVAAETTYFASQPQHAEDDSLAYQVPPDAPPGPVSLTLTAVDWAGRSESISQSWQVLQNSLPTGTIAFSPGTPAVAYQGATLRVEVSAQDVEGLTRIGMTANGDATPSPASLQVTGTRAVGWFDVTVAPTADPGAPIGLTGHLTDTSGATTAVGPLMLGVLADTGAPVITTVTPHPEQVVTEGQAIGFDFSLEDEVGVVGVTLTVDGQIVAATLTGAAQPGQPWRGRVQASWLVPAVTSTRTVGFSLEARDPVGNSLPAQGTFVVQAVTNPLAPVVTIKCPADGDGVRPGTGLSVAFRLQDTDRMEHYTVAVDGVVVYTSPVLNAVSIDGTYWWTPPSGSTPGAVFTVRVEALDYAGNMGAAEVRLVVPVGRLLVGDQVLDVSYTEPLVLAAGTFTVPAGGLLAPGVRVMSGARLVTLPAQPLGVTVPAAGELRVDCGGSVDASGQGYVGGSSLHLDGYAPDGVRASSPTSGGSHGGLGRALDGSGPAGDGFDSLYLPTLAGGGGSASGTIGGGRGGGIVTLEAGSVVIEGAIAANGSPAVSGGAGGAVRVKTNALAGKGSIQAEGSGDWSGGSSGTPGGGGRVAIEANDLRGFNPGSQVSIRGGGYLWSGGSVSSAAGSGTVFVGTAQSVHGELLVGQNGVSTAAWTVLPSIGTGVVGAVVAEGADASVELATGASMELGAVGMWVRVEGVDYRVLAQADRQHMLLGGAAGQVQPGQHFEGVYKLDRLTIGDGTWLEIWDRVEVTQPVSVPASAKLHLHRPMVSPGLTVESGGQIWMEGDASVTQVEFDATCTIKGTIRAGDITVKSGARVTSSDSDPISLKATGVLRVETGASLDAQSGSGGYGGGTQDHPRGFGPPDVVSPSGGSAGSHGGQGSRLATVGSAISFSGVAGEAYDSVVAPGLGGGGGSYAAEAAGPGAGVIDIEAAVVELDGTLVANPWDPAGYVRPVATGAGGAVRVVAGVLRGTGFIRAYGASTWGPYSNTRYGAGGGGRVALEVGSFDGFVPDAQVMVQGGTSTGSSGPAVHGGAGTLWIKTAEAVFGALVVDQRLTSPAEVAWTLVPGVGEGTVGGVVVDGPDAWLVPDGGSRLDLGVVGGWVRVAGTDYRVKRQTDRQHILLEGAAGRLSAGQPFVGVCRLDKVTVRGHARLVIPDLLWEGAVVDVDPGAVLMLRNEDAPVVTPALFQQRTSAGKFLISAGQAAVSDTHGIGSVVLRNRRTDQRSTATVGSDGSISATQVLGSPGDEVEAIVTDGHPWPRSTTVLVAVLPANAGPPVITVANVVLDASNGQFRVRGNAGAIVDQDGILVASVQNPSRNQSVVIGSVAVGGSFASVTLPAGWQIGDLLRIEAKDGHPVPGVSQQEIGAIPANAGPPAIDPVSISIELYQKRFSVRGNAGAITDPDGVVSASIINQARNQSVAIGTVLADGRFSRVVLPGDWLGGELLQIEAVDGHPASATNRENLRTLPVNLGPPTIDLSLLHTAADPPTFGASTFRGHGGAVVDADQPVEIKLRNLRTLAQATSQAGSDGGFVISFQSEPGDTIEVTATDGHPQAQWREVSYLRNLPPQVNSQLIEVLYVAPDPARGLGAGYDVVVRAGAITDNQPPLLITLGRDSNGDQAFDTIFGTWTFTPGADAVLRLDGGPVPGDRLLLQVEDSHPTDRMWKRIAMGRLPADNFAPIVDASKIHFNWDGEVLHLVGDALGVVDPDAPISLDFTNQTRTTETYELTIGDGQPFDIEVLGHEGELFTLKATDARAVPMTRTVVDLGPVPVRGNTPPRITPERIHYSWVSQVELRLVGDPQAVVDLDTPVHLVATNQTTSTEYTGQVDGDGSFTMSIEGVHGQEFWLEATDSHPQSLHSEVSVGLVPERQNDKPVIAQAKLHLTWVEGVLHMIGDGGAVVDPDKPVNLLATNQQTGAAVSGQAVADGSFDLVVVGEPGHVFRLRATDSHATPEEEEVEAGTVPERPNTAPVVDVTKIRFARIGGVLSLSGQPLAVVDPDQPVSLVATNAATNQEYGGTAGEDGSFSIAIGGQGGDAFKLRATDSHVPSLTTEVWVGTLPPANTAPEVHVDLIHLEWVDGVLRMRGEPGAVADPDIPILLRARNEDTQVDSTGQAAADGSFNLSVQGEPGELFTLLATDSHCLDPLGTPAEVGEVPLRPNSGPKVDRSKIHFVHEVGEPVRILFDAGAVVDPDWPVQVELVDEMQPGLGTEASIESSDAFELELEAAGGDTLTLVATDSHADPMSTREEHLGPVPAPNEAPPTIDQGRLHLVWDTEGRLHLTGETGAVTDPDRPVTATGLDRDNQRAFSATAAADGSFDIVVEAEPRHFFVVRAIDGHPQAKSTEEDFDYVPDRPVGSPQVQVDRISIVNDGSGPIRVVGEPGAVEDPAVPVGIVIADRVTSAEFQTSAAADGSFDVEVQAAPGDSIELVATDGEPLTTRVSLGPVPEPGKPSLRTGLVYLYPLGAGFQVVGDSGAVTGGNGARTAMVATGSGGTWTSAVLPDGSFRVPLPVAPHEQLAVVVHDGDGDATADRQLEAWVGYDGWYHWGRDLAGHTVSRLVDGRLAILDAGHAVTIARSSGEIDSSMVLGGLAAAQDVFFNHKLHDHESDGDEFLNLMALDGGNLVGWQGEGTPVTWAKREYPVTATGTLKRANARGDEVYVVGEEPSGLRFFRLDLPTFTGTSLGPGCEGGVRSVDLPGVRHAIEMASGPEGVIAVITDDPAAELWLLDVGAAGPASSLGTVDLQGDAAPTWAVWDAGNLLMARSDGRVELWRWASPSTMVLAGGWQSQDGTPTSATLIGDQLFVGLEVGPSPLTGRVVQVSLHEPLQPMLMGASTFDHPIVTMARDGRLQLVAPQDELISDEITELPPSVQPERVSWGHGTDANNTGRSWATVVGADGSSGWDFTVRLFWPGEERSMRSGLNERRVAVSDTSTPPVVVGVGLNNVPSSPYSPWTGSWRGFDSPRPPSYSVGLHRDPPTGCLTDLGIAGGTHTDDLRVVFTATAARGQADARYYFSVEGRPETGMATLSTNGPVAEMFVIETEILVLDDSLSVWATNPAHNGDQRAPVPVAGLSGVNLFGAAPVANGVIAGDRVIALGGDPASLAVVRFAPPPQEPGDPGFTVLRDGTADVDRLPNLAGAVIDVTADGYLVWVLTNDTGTFKVFRYRFTEDASTPPVLEQQVDLDPGEPPVAIGIRGSDDTHEEGDAIAIVRKSDGVELRGDDLGFISHTSLPGDALDIIWGSFVLLGDFGVAELGGPNASPTPSFVRSNAWSPGRAVHATTHIATPGGPTW